MKQDATVVYANAALAAYLNCAETERLSFMVDVHYWIEHIRIRTGSTNSTMSDIRYMEESADGLTSRYQIILSSSTGEIIDLYDLNKLRQE